MLMECLKGLVWSCITGPFDVFNGDNSDYGMYSDLAENTLDTEVGIYHILQTISIYCIGIALILGLVTLMISTFGSLGKIGEHKKYLIRVFVIAVLIFAVVGIVSLVAAMAIK